MQETETHSSQCKQKESLLKSCKESPDIGTEIHLFSLHISGLTIWHSSLLYYSCSLSFLLILLSTCSWYNKATCPKIVWSFITKQFWSLHLNWKFQERSIWLVNGQPRLVDLESGAHCWSNQWCPSQVEQGCVIQNRFPRPVHSVSTKAGDSHVKGWRHGQTCQTMSAA